MYYAFPLIIAMIREDKNTKAPFWLGFIRARLIFQTPYLLKFYLKWRRLFRYLHMQDLTMMDLISSVCLWLTAAGNPVLYPKANQQYNQEQSCKASKHVQKQLKQYHSYLYLKLAQIAAYN